MKASAFIATSIDGFIARNDGGIDWLGGPETHGDEDYGYGVFMRSVDALLMGRITFEKVLTLGEWSYGEKRVVVLSSCSIEIPDTLTSTVEQSSLEPAELLANLEGEGVDHVYVDGGKTIQGFLRAGLLDELIISRLPILIGGGIPLFGELAGDIALEHVATRAYESGIVKSTYRMVT